MNELNLQKDFPNIFEKLDENEKDLNQIRYFVVINENYEDIDDEEVDVFDPADYNYLAYITERLSNILGDTNLEILANTLEQQEYIQNFLASEEDLFGIKSDLDEEELGLKILQEAEKILKEHN
jgi:hypothetical protein